MSGTYPQSPYGEADFEDMRRERTVYVDKTRYLISTRRGARRPTAARDSQPDRQATDVRLPARTMPGDVRVFSVNLHACGRLVHEMAYRDAWQPVLVFLAAAIVRQSRIHDYIDEETVISGVPGGVPELHRALRAGAWRWLRRHRPRAAPAGLHCHSPRLRDRAPNSCGARSQRTRAGWRRREAAAPLRRYPADERSARQYPSVHFTGLLVVFHDRALVNCDAVSGH